ncbi:DUF4167 domain-containing protein [Jannaschia sp. Os4]|uniref:DUF4167 domain-containing protein n=1 Tax=Jannaschia sp. Os4 TaxID=2807617 RepID=UPI001939F836|nr:DUF4167 domain-containing protein [Jannaschia sp. Os4]MBM2577482.1 DUF4167 domain-containing protein [Jannaschia sp. Os4]
MRSSKSRSRNKNRNRNQGGGNVVNRVFDSSGPEGKVRGTPQQIIDKYNQLARDAQLSGDRVAVEAFQQHAEHYSRMLAAALKEQEARQQQQGGNQNNQGNQQNGQGGGGGQGGNQGGGGQGGNGGGQGGQGGQNDQGRQERQERRDDQPAEAAEPQDAGPVEVPEGQGEEQPKGDKPRRRSRRRTTAKAPTEEGGDAPQPSPEDAA